MPRDVMPVSSEAEKRRDLIPDHQVLREVERDGLIYRYEDRTEDGPPPGEGAFGI